MFKSMTWRAKLLSNPTRVHVVALFALSVLPALAMGCGILFSRPHSVTLTWTASTSKVVGYNVYRASLKHGGVKKLTPQPIAETRFVDSHLEVGDTYTYFVTAVDSEGVESRASDAVVASVPLPWVQRQIENLKHLKIPRIHTGLGRLLSGSTTVPTDPRAY